MNFSTSKFLSKVESAVPYHAPTSSFLSITREIMCTVKKLTIFPSPACMSLTKLSLAGKNLIIPGQGEFG